MTTPAPMDFLTLTIFGGRLYAINRAGEPLALYVYAPLRQAYLGRYDVPFAPQWPDYARPVVMQYEPMPVLGAEQLPDRLEGDVTQQSREDDPERPWTQIVYRQWPLYYVPGQDAGGAAQTPPAMFTPALEGMDPPSGQEPPDVTWPTTVLGP